MKIYIFTLEGCIYCKKLKNTLKKNSISFIDVDIDKNEELWNTIIKQTGYDYAPTVYITKENDEFGNVYVPQIDYEDDKDMLQIIKNLINVREK
jgi:glutaredoxin